MKKIKNILLAALFFSMTGACGKSTGTDNPGNGGVEAHYAKGRVLDESGQPLKNVKVIIENVIAYGEAITPITDENGYYKAKLGIGGSYRVAYGEITRTLEGRTFNMRVHSNDRNLFTYEEGAVVNLTWKLSGPMEPTPTDHYYGGPVQFYYVNGGVNFDYITFTFEPIVLIDGSKPASFTRKVTNGYYVPDIPIGKYKITGTYQEPNGPLYTLDFRDVAANPNGPFSLGSIIATFYPDANSCTNCLKLDFQ